MTDCFNWNGWKQEKYNNIFIQFSLHGEWRQFPASMYQTIINCISKYYNKKPKVFMLNSMLKLNPAFGLIVKNLFFESLYLGIKHTYIGSVFFTYSTHSGLHFDTLAGDLTKRRNLIVIMPKK
jgi:hypothetical protein